ncbi:TIGR02679 domain-containing protein [Clostridium sp.]|uniref:TIGR02679 domain-containing protein n=1 Tax=Clostridium sp. TaxID=1506 RepID=UPI00261C16D9|nr:TIGR02679 domain-containing protein [Clostridium sp.]
MGDKEKEAIGFLKENKQFHKLLDSMKEKYVRMGKLTGKVSVKELTSEESLSLSAIEPEIYGKDSGDISIKKFVNYFTKGRFEGIDFFKVFNEYYGGTLKTNKENKEEKINRKDNFLDQLLNGIKESHVEIWLRALIEYKKYGYNIFIKQYKEDKDVLKEIMLNLEKAMEFIPFCYDEGIPLATLSSKVTKDSHYFDMNKCAGKLLLQVLAYYMDKNMNYALEEINEVLSLNGIIRDEISNTTITAGLFCYDENEEISGYKWFRRGMEPIILSIHNLKGIKTINAREKSVFIFENPTSFYEVLRECKDLRPSLICISGQPNSSTHIILNHLIKEGCKLFYAGDFDPEGIIICDNLKKRYDKALEFMCMNKEYYLKIKSQNSFGDRIAKLDGIVSKELLDLVYEMKEDKNSAYQELLTNEYVNYIKARLE